MVQSTPVNTHSSIMYETTVALRKIGSKGVVSNLCRWAGSKTNLARSGAYIF